MTLNRFLLIVISMIIAIQSNCQTTKADYQLPDKFKKTNKWKERDSSERLENTYYSCNYSATMTLTRVLQIIDKEQDFDSLCQAKSWCIKNYSLVFSKLIERLADTSTIGLKPHIDLTITDREMPLWLSTGGKPGIHVNEDIFTIAGRASWILNDITGENFALVRQHTTVNQLKEFQKKWVDWIKKLKTE